MTISTTSRKAGPFIGTGAQTIFPFSFKIFAASDLQVTRTSVAGVDSVLTLGSGYLVVPSGDQEATPGGYVTLPGGAALPSGEKLTIIGNLPITQPTDITNNSGFYASVIEQALDRLVMFIQQVVGLSTRTIRFPVSDSFAPSDLPTAAVRAGKALIFTPTGDVGLSSTPFDDQAAAAAASAAAAAASAATASTQAGISTAQAVISTTQAGTATGAAATATTQAGIATVQAAAAAASFDDFDDRYLGAKAADPALDNDGNPLINGALYFNTGANVMRVYSTGLGTWGPATSNNVRYGSTAPSNALGSDGDFYIRTGSWDLYGPKAGGTWPLATSLIGPNGPGTGDVIGPNSSITDQLVVYQGATGKLIKAAAISGLAKLTGGVLSAAQAVTDFIAPGLIVGNGITMNTNRLLGRTTAGAGGVEELTVGTGLTLSSGTLIWSGSVGNHEVRVTTGNGYGSTATKIRRFTTTVVNVGTAITYADSAANGGSFTINETGIYNIYVSDVDTANGASFGASLNASSLTANVDSLAATQRPIFASVAPQFYSPASKTVRLTAGDVIRLHAGAAQSAENNIFVELSIRKVNT